MKKTTNILLVTILLLAAASCGKKDNTTGNTTSGLLKSTTSIVQLGAQSDTTVTTFTYDNQNRVITQVAVSLSGTGTTTYAYYTDSVVQNTVGVNTTYYLNSSGYRTSDNLGDTWTYNSGGYLTGKTTIGGSTTNYTYNGLNQLATQTNVVSGITTVDTYTYASNPISHAGSSWSTGVSTGALPQTDVNVKNGAANYTLTFTYTLDSQNRLGTEVVNSTASTSPVTTYYAYY